MFNTNYLYYVFTFLISLVFTLMTGRVLVPRLREKAAQPIYADGPSWHAKKSGTPTMGGVSFVLGICSSLLIAALYLQIIDQKEDALSLVLSVGFALLNSFVGIIDDIKKLRKKDNAGLTPTQKLILQGTFAALFLLVRYIAFGKNESIMFSFGEFTLGWMYYPLTFLVLVGITNCANLTDGIDGLASGVAFAIAASLFYISSYVSSEVSFIGAAVMGGAIAFLVFNIHPAKVFMGDTGSLFFGALIATTGIVLDNPIITLIVGGIYVIEGASVILQVTSFKLTRRRIFKMAPIHHHLERCGWSENKICVVAIIATFIFAFVAYILSAV